MLVSPEELHWNARLANLPRLSEFGTVTQGFVTGADEIFIIQKRQVPDSEGAVYIDYLPDRVISRYKLPARADEVVFYPFEDGEELDQKALANRFPKTWAYLLAHRSQLQARKSVLAGTVQWWRPERPREPARLLRPKIV